MDVLLSMPDELLRHLLSEWFDITTIARLDSAYLSRNSRLKFISHVYNSKTVFKHNSRTSAVSTNKQQELIEWLVQRGCRVRHLCISIELQQNEELMVEFFRSFGSSLEKIEIRETTHVHPSEFLWGLLLEHCNNLQEFCVNGCIPEISDYLHELSICCPSINKLSITPRLVYPFPRIVLGKPLHFKKLRCVNLTHAVFAGELLATFAPESPLLEELHLQSPGDITADQLAIIAHHCPFLHTISMFEVLVSDEDLQLLFNGCKNLQKLEVAGSRDTLTNQCLRCIAQHCPLLTTLNLQTCLSVTDDGLCEVFKHCTNLRDLTLRGNILLTDATLSALALYCPLLTTLSVRGRFEYSVDSLNAMAQSCTQLKQVCISTGRRHLHNHFQDIFPSHVKVVVTVERAIQYSDEKTDEEHAKYVVRFMLNDCGYGDY